MTFREQAEAAATAIAEALPAPPSDEQNQEIVMIVERTMIQAVLRERDRCVSAASRCIPADQDTAHKIADEIRRDEIALITNLVGMRS
jgi:hypothetical protein